MMTVRATAVQTMLVATESARAAVAWPFLWNRVAAMEDVIATVVMTRSVVVGHAPTAPIKCWMDLQDRQT
jgi:hypothetical protein